MDEANNIPQGMPERLQRMLEDIPVRRSIDAAHELPPTYPVPAKSISDQIADKSIGIIDEAASHVMAKMQELKDKVSNAEQMVLNSQVEVRETIRAHMRIVEAAAKINQQVDQQLAEAMKPLAELTNGK